MTQTPTTANTLRGSVGRAAASGAGLEDHDRRSLGDLTILVGTVAGGRESIVFLDRFFVVIVVVVIVRVKGAMRAFALDDPPQGDGADEGGKGEEPPGEDDVALLDAEGEDGAGQGGAGGPTEAAEGGGEAVHGAEDADGGGGVGEEDGGAREADDDDAALDEEEEQEEDVSEPVVLYQGGVGNKKIDDREK